MSDQRFHALDSLRAVMMLLGIFIHAALNYMAQPIPLYFYKDVDTSRAMDVWVFFIHLFRMPTFFVMAGFFAALLLYRRSKKDMLVNRAKRIALPFAIFIPVFFLLGGVVSLLCFHHLEYGVWGIDISLVDKYIPKEQQVPTTMHMWFLYHLIIFYLVSVPLLALMEKLNGLRQKFINVFSVLLSRWFGVVLISLPTIAAGFYSHYGMVEADFSFTPDILSLFYHAWFFIAGWYLYHHQGLLVQYRDKCWLYLAAALVTMVLSLVGLGVQQEGTEAMKAYGFNLSAVFVNLSTWCWILFWIGFFERYFSNHSKFMRYITDSSYWVYLLHVFFTMLFAVAIRDLVSGFFVKYILVMLLTILVCMVTYHFLVRSTIIGVLLNGKKR